MPRSSLDGAFAKLDRADVHLGELKDSIERWRDDEPCRVVSQEDADTGECVLRGEVLKRPDRTWWGLLIGDCVQNLRASLDYVIYELARIEQTRKGNVKDPKQTGFPILSDPGSWKDELRNDSRRVGHLGLVAEDVQRAVKDFQPYERRPDRPWSDPLAVLSALSNADKHRLVHVAQHAASGVTYSLDVWTKLGVDIGSFHPLGAFEHGGDIERLPGLARCAELADQLNFTYDVAFDPEGPGRGGLVLSQLEVIRDHTRDEVVPKLSEFFDG